MFLYFKSELLSWLCSHPQSTVSCFGRWHSFRHNELLQATVSIWLTQLFLWFSPPAATKVVFFWSHCVSPHLSYSIVMEFDSGWVCDGENMTRGCIWFAFAPQFFVRILKVAGDMFLLCRCSTVTLQKFKTAFSATSLLSLFISVSRLRYPQSPRLPVRRKYYFCFRSFFVCYIFTVLTHGSWH